MVFCGVFSEERKKKLLLQILLSIFLNLLLSISFSSPHSTHPPPFPSTLCIEFINSFLCCRYCCRCLRVKCIFFVGIKHSNVNANHLKGHINYFIFFSIQEKKKKSFFFPTSFIDQSFGHMNGINI